MEKARVREVPEGFACHTPGELAESAPSSQVPASKLFITSQLDSDPHGTDSLSTVSTVGEGQAWCLGNVDAQPYQRA